YLRSEIKDWEGNQLKDGYVLADGHFCKELQTQSKCEDLWGRTDFAGATWALLRITPNDSVEGFTGGGQVQQEK
ncbi:MAG TPA: hypothetical protein VEU98_00455, partial [Candidatus Eremiobacteraceae bacterium]|nr:hypothetical protein [Candidatus Eremiobacteraceae bacterium]